MDPNVPQDAPLAEDPRPTLTDHPVVPDPEGMEAPHPLNVQDAPSVVPLTPQPPEPDALPLRSRETDGPLDDDL